jgi:hypothetical protein
MPFIDNAPGESHVSKQQSALVQTLTVADSATDTTRKLNALGMSSVIIVVTQTAGAPGFVRLLGRAQGANITYPTTAIALLNVPVLIEIPIGIRECVVQVEGPVAGGPHTFTVAEMVTA